MRLPIKLDHDSRYKAITSRDSRYDGLFFTAVKTTGIYCRPSCPAPHPLQKNVVFYETVEQARQAGFRACKRCHPDRLKECKAKSIVESVQGADSTSKNIADLAREHTVTERHLRRIIRSKVGVSPVKLRQAKRLETARMLLVQTDLSIVDVAFSADFQSLRQFNHAFKQAFSVTPREMRVSQHRICSARPVKLHLKLAYKQPMEWQPLVAGFLAHTVPHLDHYDETTHTITRHVQENNQIVKVAIDLNDYGNYVKVCIETPDITLVDKIVARVRRLLDLDHNPAKINTVLSADPMLAPLVAARPGLRIMGSWSPFELMICTIIGQQISVVAARTFAGRLVHAYGQLVHGSYLFPTAETLANADPLEMYKQTNLNSKKIASIQQFAQLVLQGLYLEDPSRWSKNAERILTVRGIGPWSVEYVGLRGMGEPNAFPADDLLVKRRLGAKNAKEATAKTELWQPFRGYGVMHIWAEGAYT